MPYTPVIGLEVHAQLLTETKIFCGCGTAFGDPPNTHVCPVCLGYPGVLPVLNRRAVFFALKLALALNCRVNRVSTFARKNYFYPDLPKGYQITQYEKPLAENGVLQIEKEGEKRNIAVRRVHLEEDAGKSIHGSAPDEAENTFLDFNRTGVPLVEIVTRPDLSSPEEAHAFLVRLKSLLQYIEICDGNMEEGSLRCDANLSIRKKGASLPGPKTEIKNLNSFRNVRRALAYEFDRQVREIDAGGPLDRETRFWDDHKMVTLPLRAKEDIQDYRYFPEPDLPDLLIEASWLDEARGRLPELPAEKKERFMKAYGLPEKDADVLIFSRDMADYFEAACRVCPHPKMVAGWIMTELLRELKRGDMSLKRCPATPEKLGWMLNAIRRGRISGKIAKTVFSDMCAGGKHPRDIIAEKKLGRITDEDRLAGVIHRVIHDNPGPHRQYLDGKTRALPFFMGEVMKRTGGKADPGILEKLLKALLKKEKADDTP